MWYKFFLKIYQVIFKMYICRLKFCEFDNLSKETYLTN